MSNETKILADDFGADSDSGHLSLPADIGDSDRAPVVGDIFGADKVKANVGSASLSMLVYDPFANVGKVLKMPNLPRLAPVAKPLQLNELKWYQSAGKPPAPKGFYWQASGSKTEMIGKRKKKIVAGWLLIKSGNCQGCGDRYRPPIIYLKGSAWATLQGESYGRQRAEITFMLGKSRTRLNDLRCPKCVQGFHGQMPVTGTAS